MSGPEGRFQAFVRALTNWADEQFLSRLFRFFSKAIEAETTRAGRVNLYGMMLGFLVVVTVSVAPILEALVKLLRPEAELGVPLLPVILVFFVFMFACVFMLVWLEEGERR